MKFVILVPIFKSREPVWPDLDSRTEPRSNQTGSLLLKTWTKITNFVSTILKLLKLIKLTFESGWDRVTIIKQMLKRINRLMSYAYGKQTKLKGQILDKGGEGSHECTLKVRPSTNLFLVSWLICWLISPTVLAPLHVTSHLLYPSNLFDFWGTICWFSMSAMSRLGNLNQNNIILYLPSFENIFVFNII